MVKYIVRSVGWYPIFFFFFGWLSGFLFPLDRTPGTLPTYELTVEHRSTQSPLMLGPKSQLSIALVPNEDTPLLPHLCAYTSNGSTLRQFPVSYRLLRGGTLLISGEVDDLLPLAVSEREATRELFFRISSSFGICQPTVAHAFEAFENLLRPWLPAHIFSLFAVQSLRLAVNFLPARS